MVYVCRGLIIALLMSFLGGCAIRGLGYAEGIASFQRQDYRQAFIRLKPEAKRGQPDAQYAVGYMYYYGQGVVENREKAKYWIIEAASHGQPDAIRAAKLMGIPVPPHPKPVPMPPRM
ncbi:Sel-1 protein [Legionella geestiana]|uniref:Sel-1 protein n=2 Tax=Legionella geestiana TaxID=45065 RepID=A0A0W0TPL7_9GAMM|nr:Sel-1 protein [Legionella geestiana]QBS13295.1 sel1 repeat family protein [Legionella geestiana]QDQ40885.1 sel1 repeat family protein [Legionella geestiana]STX54178.1 Sel-1 protein [Legionella geestiana]